MKLFDLTFSGPVQNTKDLFFRGNARLNEKNQLEIKSGDEVSFDTYFNLFSHSKYFEYCEIEKISLFLRASGSYSVNFYHKNVDGSESLILQTQCEKDAEINLDLTDTPKNGFVFFKLTARSDVVLKFGGYYAEPKFFRDDVKIGGVICTFKREEFVRRNISGVEKFMTENPEWKDKIHFFVSDNAKTLDLKSNDFYTIIPNKNLGGSGGFTRGMTEVMKDKTFTHFLLTDDDISFDCRTLVKTYNLICALSPKYRDATVGGSMLILEKPYIQHEMGGFFNGLKISAGNSGADLSDVKNLIKNETPLKADYNAWWYCCMPVEYAFKNGLPLPLFIKCDDVEYGIRCITNLILMNGIGIWHQDFSAKYNPTLEYYITRNELLVNALHFKGHFKASLKFLFFLFRQLTLKRYFCAKLILQAHEDFFKGPDFFNDTDMEELNKKIMSSHPQYYDINSLASEYAFSEDEIEKLRNFEKQPSGLMKKALLGFENFLPTCFFKNKLAFTDANAIHPSHAFLKKTVINVDFNNNRGYVTSLDKKLRRNLRRRGIKMFFKLLFRYGKTKKQYIKRQAEICSAAQWDKKFFEKSQD